MTASSSVCRIEPLDDGALWRVTFGEPPGNILDARVMRALAEMFREAGRTTALRAICLQGAGDQFSYGASVQEHLPSAVAPMLAAFREVLVSMFECAVPVAAAVRGRCLGGGLELASACHRIVASPLATFGQPEITLGVFAPFASLLLPGRVGRGVADDLLLSGRSLDALEAQRAGLVDEISADPLAAAESYAREHWLSKSASSLRLAVRAARASLTARFATEWPAMERLYLDTLMHTPDASEGLRAFLEKRPPRWRHH